jgi:NAD-dependent deacetylase
MKKKRLVVLTGAGISAESGLKTFRDSDGLWEGFDVQEVATHNAWKKNPELVLSFYNQRRRNVSDAVPNKAHFCLAELQEDFDLQVITQNIDDLHERAGSLQVLHLHGEIFKMRSESSEDRIYEIRDDMKMGDLAEDGFQLRPHIVWFGEAVPMIEKAARIVSGADLFAVIGTSLVVYPAAGLVHYAPRHIPKFIVDRSVPQTGDIPRLTEIEKPASEGVQILRDLLIRDYR